MRKAWDYYAFRALGLPIPLFDVFDDRALHNQRDRRRLAGIVDRILSRGSGQIGVRTEPKGVASLIHNYPHFMPLRDLRAVEKAMCSVQKSFPDLDWWFLVNEAFSSYHWNAVIKLTDLLPLPGGLRIDGEVNLLDDLPLRAAMDNTQHLTPARLWRGDWPARLRHIIIRSGLTERWIEVSLVRTNDANRLVFWGLRPNFEFRWGAELPITVPRRSLLSSED